MDLSASPVALAMLALAGFALLRLGLLWIVFRLVSSILRRPACLFLAAVAVAAALGLG